MNICVYIYTIVIHYLHPLLNNIEIKVIRKKRHN